MVDVSQVINRLLPSLNAGNTGELAFWTTTDLYEHADEAAKRLASRAGVFAERDTSTALVGGTGLYTLPSRHLAVLRASVANAGLERASVQQLIALSDTWQADAGTPARWAADSLGYEQIRLHPAPTASGALELVMTVTPPDITAAAPQVEASDVVGDYLELRMLAGARRREGDGALPEVADALDQQTELLERVFASYYGGGL